MRIIRIIFIFVFFISLVFCLQPSVGIFGDARGVRYEGFQNIPLSQTTESNVQTGRSEGTQCNAQPVMAGLNVENY